MLRVGHSSDLETVKRALRHCPLDGIPVATSIQEALSTNVSILVKDDCSDTNTFRDILQQAPDGSTIHLVENTYNTLRDAKVLYGDNMPRRARVGKAAFGKHAQLSLNLLWQQHCGSISQLNNAEMDPWTRLLTQEELIAELSVSTRIVT
jgi:hypothetical protein